MERQELAAILTSLVRAKTLSRAEADRVLAAYDGGDLALDLPDAPEPDNNDWLAALALLLLLVRGHARRPLSLARRARSRRLLRADFDSTVTQLAQAVTLGGIAIPTWQERMQQALSRYTRQMAVAGRGRLPSVAMRQAIDGRLADQWPYLRRFAVTLAAREAVDRPLSEAHVASRSRSYGASAWGGYFLAQGEEAQPGMVDQWISRDDGRVCRNCFPRHLQYFLPSQGPQPGWDCLGRCRCVRVPVFAPEIYAELTVQRRAA